MLLYLLSAAVMIGALRIKIITYHALYLLSSGLGLWPGSLG